MPANSLALPSVDIPKPHNSILTFAVIWDPERGLETFSGGELEDHVARLPTLRKSTFADCGDSTGSEYSDSDDEDTPIATRKKEPFALFGTRGSQFIDICSSSAYERCILDPNFSEGVSPAPYPRNSALTPPSRDSNARTARAPQRDQRVFPPSPSPSASKIGRPCVSRADSGVDMTYSMYKSRSSSEDRHGHSSLSGSCQSRDSSNSRRPPRSSRPPIDRRPISQHNSGQRVSTAGTDHCACAFCNQDDKTLHKLYDVDQLYLTEGAIHYNDCIDSSEEENSDEGFYESSPRPIEEQLLPSRFSVTTTSTSTFVSVNRRDIPPPTPPHGSRGFAAQQSEVLLRRPRLPSLKNRLTAIKSIASHHEPSPKVNANHGRQSSYYEEHVSRLSRALKSHLPKRLIHPHEDEWVFVEVQSIVVDKVIDV